MTRRSDLGRVHGYVIPAADVQAHEACGWVVVDDLADGSPRPDEALMAPPTCEPIAERAAR